MVCGSPGIFGIPGDNFGTVVCNHHEQKAFLIVRVIRPLQQGSHSSWDHLRGHPGVQKHCRATSTIFAIQMCYVGNRKPLVLILKATKGVHYQR